VRVEERARERQDAVRLRFRVFLTLVPPVTGLGVQALFGTPGLQDEPSDR
jgi:hypothetical protein